MPDGAAHERERQPVLDAARRRALAAQLARRIPAKGKRARRAQRRCEEDIHALWRHAAYAKQRAERTAGAADQEPQRQHVVGEAAQTGHVGVERQPGAQLIRDRKSTRLNSSHGYISYAVFCLKKKKNTAKKRTPNSGAS